MESGIVIINKEQGDTSQRVVSKVKKNLNVKKAGHIGTLDPLATGVLPVLIGNGTKMSKYLIEHDKTYVATLKLGEKRDTGDEEGEVVDKQEVCDISKNRVNDVLNMFQGKQMQSPHKYSAVKVDGKKLYEYAREGKDVAIPLREIEIYYTKLINFDNINNEIIFEVKCSKGTYIRVLCENIAEKLDTIGYMKCLQRIEVDSFNIKDAVKLNDLTQKNIISIEKICKEKYEKLCLNDRKLELFLNGVMLTVDLEDGIYMVYNKEKFIGLGIVKNRLIKRDVII